MRIHPSLLFLLLSLYTWSLNAQDQAYRTIYLTGNTQSLDVKSVFFNDLFNRIEKETRPSTLLLLGDFSSKRSLKSSLTDKLQYLKKEKDIKISMIPGDSEWNDLQSNGSSYVKKLEANIEDKIKKAVSPNNGCPGPHEIKLDKQTVLISINTSWFLTSHTKQEGFNSKCSLLFESEFYEELDDIIEDNKGKNIIIAGHHPIYSNGYYGGKGARWMEWLPVLGSMFYAYRNHDGSPDYLSNKRYQHFRVMMERILKKHQGLIYLSGHEHSIEIQNINGNLHINSGAARNIRKGAKSESSLFTQYKKGYTCISLYDDGRVKAKVFNTDNKSKTNSFVDYVMLPPCTKNIADNKILNHQLSDCNLEITTSQTIPIEQVQTGKEKAIPGIEYKANGFKKLWMGEHYREEWTTAVSLPYLNLKTEHGGLKAIGKGGGKQTNSLKLINNRKEQYAFRSVNKNTGRDPYDPFRNTLVTSYTQELISNQLPFGDVLVAKLLDNTDILHVNPKPFIMPNDPALGIYQKDFANVVGTLEMKPKGKKGIRPGFANADIVISSNQMYNYLISNNSNYIDRLAFAKTVLFDAWVGDWDKHGDNWKWAGYKEGKHYKFVPIPKDRDHVFAIYEGILPSIAKQALPFYSDFTNTLDNVDANTYQGRHLVNFVGSKLTKEDWTEAATYLKSRFNRTNIDKAFDVLPAEMRDISKKEIKSALIDRLDQLQTAADDIFKKYNKVGLIVGSNEKEKFRIQRNQDASVTVQVLKAKSEKLIFEKNFQASTTKEIQIYGLGKDDQFTILGDCDKTISIRIIGGKGEDEIRDLAKIANNRKVTKVYDKFSNDKIEAGANTKIKKEYQDPDYKIFDFEYDALIPLFAPSYTTDFGFFFVGTFDYKNHGFNKPDYHHSLTGDFRWVPNLKNFRLKGKYRYRQFWGDRNLLVRYKLALNDIGFDDFYGIGNNTRRIESLDKANFYDFNNSHYSLSVGINKQLFNKSNFEFGIGLEHFNMRPANSNPSIFDLNAHENLFGIGKTGSSFFETRLEIDFLDNSSFPTAGAKLNVKHRLAKLLNGEKQTYGYTEVALIEYYSFEIIKEATLAIKVGGSYNYGETPFYHLSNLGNNNNLRTYASNLFLGTSSVYSNFQLRHSIGTLQNKIIPFNYGLILFYDIGRVFNNQNFNFQDWNYGYGTGLYASILDGLYNVHLSIGANQYDQRFIRLGLGLGLE